jgi:hypothetical protein
VVEKVRWSVIKNKTTAEQKIYLMNRTGEIGIQQTKFYFKLQERENELLERLVRIDTMDAVNLNTFATSCINLASNTEDSLKVLRLRKNSIWAVQQLRKNKRYNASALINAAFIYSVNGLYNAAYYDTARVIYDRINYLINVDSIEIPKIAMNDKQKWIDELMEIILEYRTYNKFQQQDRNRKYSIR